MSAPERSLDEVLLDVVTASMCSAIMRTVQDREGILAMLNVDPSMSFGKLIEPAAQEFLQIRRSFREEILEAAARERVIS